MLRRTATSIILFLATLSCIGITVAAQKNYSEAASEGGVFVSAAPDKTGGARIDGRGFTGWELIEIEVVITPGFLAPKFTVGKWDVAADGKGEFNSFWQGTTLSGQVDVTARGVNSSRVGFTTFFYEGTIVLAGGGSLEQCGNGPQLAQVACSGSAWQNGNLNENQAHYAEGESVPYRIRFTGLDIAVQHTVTIEWDTTENGKHALDYITSYNRSETDADACSGIEGCNPGIFTTYPIPFDGLVAAGHDGVPGTTDDIEQVPGVLTLFNGTITGASPYYRTGSYDGSSKTGIQITFTTTATNPVLVWGGHISTRMNWGVGNSAIAISGSPYHMRVIEIDGSSGNMDRSLSASAAIFPGSITIIKDAEPEVGLPCTFAATGPGVNDFTLDDDGYPQTNYPDSIKFEGLTFFGPTNQVTITETAMPGIFSVGDLLCTSDPNGGTGTNNNTTDLDAQRVVINLEEGEAVTCTFLNLIAIPTASEVSISGRVTDMSLIGIPRIELVLYPMNGDPPFVASSNAFGSYIFTEVPVGRSYLLTIRGKRAVFDPPSVVIAPIDNMTGLDFIVVTDQ